MQILKIDNPKTFVKADLSSLNRILKDTEFKAKRKSKTTIAVYCTRPMIVSTEGMADFLYNLISQTFKPHNL